MSDEHAMEFRPEHFLSEIGTRGHNGLLGIRYVDHGANWCELALPYDARLVGDVEAGILASGPIVTLMDMATSISIWVRSGMFRPQATLDLRVDYLRPATPGKTVTGRGECYRLTRNIAFVRGQAHDGDAQHPLAHVAGTYMLL